MARQNFATSKNYYPCTNNQMIGLKRHTVKLVPHNDSWHAVFEETKKELLILIGGIVLDIQHVGSTSIKNIEAKLIIVIAISVDDLKVVNKIQSILEQHGYEYRGDGGKEGGHLFVKCGARMLELTIFT